MAAAGRARIEQQKQTALANIEKNKEAALTALNIQYAAADKAKTSFGYIGVTFLVVLFGSIFLNDFIKFCIYLFNDLREWWRVKKENKEIAKRTKNTQKEKDEQAIFLQIENRDLEEKLERVYFKLVEVNAKKSRNQWKLNIRSTKIFFKFILKKRFL